MCIDYRRLLSDLELTSPIPAEATKEARVDLYAPGAPAPWMTATVVLAKEEKLPPYAPQLRPSRDRLTYLCRCGQLISVRQCGKHWPKCVPLHTQAGMDESTPWAILRDALAEMGPEGSADRKVAARNYRTRQCDELLGADYNQPIVVVHPAAEG